MNVAVVGLGYVGLPLAHGLAKSGHTVYGYDISKRRIEELQGGKDRTGELSDAQMKEAPMTFSADPAILEKAQVIILAIPTPVDDRNDPDLSLVEDASRTVGKHLKKGMIVVYESTVYPGVTEELCGGILEEESGLKCGVDFTLGYSPERINPGDKEHTIDRIVKVVAGQDAKTLDILSELYGSVTKAGVHRAPNIKVAEMAKAIENAQRDLNIAFINEIAILCHKLGIETKDVLNAAGTKWNFLKFKPGLVGGHCIGVDPYYLVEKARQLGMRTHVITAGRAINDGMGAFVAEEISTTLTVNNHQPRVLVLGLTFKEDIPDTRNSKAHDVVKALEARRCLVEVHEPHMTPEEITARGMKPGSFESGPYDAIAFLVSHKEYVSRPIEDFIKATKEGGVIYDLKSLLDGEAVRKAGRKYLAL
ncbi:MAG: nucleotide sugar dehydrogenase [Candidatus Peregrinibacteria bacterium]|nr:nucleotide sugar dehydrogenase [Candidatus Peregrinibacteria bacterium]